MPQRKHETELGAPRLLSRTECLDLLYESALFQNSNFAFNNQTAQAPSNENYDPDLRYASWRFLSSSKKNVVHPVPQHILTKSKTKSLTDLLNNHLYVRAISYADGCCARSQIRNHEFAIANGVDEAIALNRTHLPDEWLADPRVANIMRETRGAGLWIWKPKIILDQLLDEALPWHFGAVLYVDSGNHLKKDPKPFMRKWFLRSDVGGPRQKCQMDGDWTKPELF